MIGAFGCQLASRTHVVHTRVVREGMYRRSKGRVHFVTARTSMVCASVASRFQTYTLPSWLPE